jgi:ligand-binding sensor domain-containing protein/signal transduction histidine kinase
MRFQRYTIHDGLSQSSVKSILQDETGFIWFATQDGLNRFDGKNFKIWKRKSDAHSSLSGNNISQLIQASNYLWIGTAGGGVNIYDSNTDSLTKIKYVPNSPNTLLDNNVASLIHTSQNEIWIGSDSGISIVNPLSYMVMSHIQNMDTSPVTVTCMVEDKNRNIWVATRHGGIYIFEGVTKKKIAHVSKKQLGLSADRVDPVRHLSCDKKGRIWVSTNNGLYLFNSLSEVTMPRKVKLITALHDFTDDVIMCSMVDHMGKLWIGTQNGVLIGEEESTLFQHYTQAIGNPYSLSDRVILCLYQDSNHITWIGTYNGVNKFVYATPKFQSYKFDIEDRSKNLSVVRSLFTDDDVHIFTGTVNALCLFDRNAETIQIIKDKQGNGLQNVFCVLKDKQNQLWTGNSNGLQKIRHTAKGYIVEDAIDHPELSLFRNSEVTQCVSIADELYLLATFHENGLYLWNTTDRSIKNFRSVPHDASSLADNKINQIQVAKNGTIWLATNQGVSKFNKENYRFTNFYPRGKAPADPGQGVVNAIADDGDILWLATNGGLMRYDPVQNISASYTEEDGLANHNLYSCMPANDSTLWMSSNKGISEFNKRTHQFTNYDASDGLQSDEYNRYAWYRSGSGKLYFGGMEGFDILSSSKMETRSVPLVITNIRIIDKNKFANLYPVHKPLHLHHSQNAIGFEYALLDFELPRRNNYLCKLEGLDKDWIDNGSYTGISYTNLRPGNYVFKVKLKEQDESFSSYAFTILTPYWQTKWFTTTVVIILLGILVFIIRQYYVRKMERQRMVYEKQQAVEYERTRIATDMHDDLGAGLSRIKFLSENIDFNMKHQRPVADDISKIKTYSHEMIGKMGEIVWALNKTNDSLSDLLSYTRAYSADYLTQNNIRCAISFPDEFPSIAVNGEFRRNIFLTVKEALHNIVKHADASVVKIDFTLGNQLTIVLQDDGKGFDLNMIRPYSNGINNMKYRMKNIRGGIEIKNDKGTLVHLWAPLDL